MKYGPFNMNIQTGQRLVKELKGKMGVYIWTCTLNGNTYVGYSVNLGRRLAEYLIKQRIDRESKRGVSLIHRGLLKYGLEAFTFGLLAEYEPSTAENLKEVVQKLRAMESAWIFKLDSNYNIIKRTNTGFSIHNAESRIRISEAAKQRWLRWRENGGGPTRTHSPSSCLRVSANSKSVKTV